MIDSRGPASDRTSQGSASNPTIFCSSHQLTESTDKKFRNVLREESASKKKRMSASLHRAIHFCSIPGQQAIRLNCKRFAVFEPGGYNLSVSFVRANRFGDPRTQPCAGYRLHSLQSVFETHAHHLGN